MSIRPGFSCGVAPASTTQPLPGLDSLDEHIYINGQLRSPVFLYKGRHATTSSWVATHGSDVPIVNAGADVTPNQDADIVNGAGQAVDFTGDDYYQMASSATYQQGTNDYILEMVMQANITTNDKIPLIKFQSSPRQGTILNWTLGNCFLTTAYNGTDYNAASDGGGGLSDDDWVHVVAIADRSGSQIVYVNKVAGTAVDISAFAGQSISNSGQFALSSSASYKRRIAWCAVWAGNNWLDTHLQPTFVTSRYNTIFGP